MGWVTQRPCWGNIASLSKTTDRRLGCKKINETDVTTEKRILKRGMRKLGLNTTSFLASVTAKFIGAILDVFLAVFFDSQGCAFSSIRPPQARKCHSPHTFITIFVGWESAIKRT